MQQLIAEITKGQLKTDLPSFRPGDTLRVHVKVVEELVKEFSFSKVL